MGSNPRFYSCIIFSVIILAYLFFSPNIILAAKEVYTDADTGGEVWWLSSGGVPYYTTIPFSPDGKMIAFGRCVLINSDGTNERTMPGPCVHVSVGGVMGMWSHDSRYYYNPEGLNVVDLKSNSAFKIPNSSGCLPFYFTMVSPDGRTLTGIGNKSDISSGVGQIKFINVDGTNCRSYNSPGRTSGGFDVTHGWIGNNAGWYLNNSQWSQFTDVMMVVNSTTGQFMGALNVGNNTWDGLFTHPTVSNSGYMIGGRGGFIGGNGNKLRYANADYTSKDATVRQLTTLGSVMGNHSNFSSDMKYVVSGATSGPNADFITVYSVPPPLSTTPGTIKRVARWRKTNMAVENSAHANFSPDGTKITFWSSDVYKSGMHVAVFRKPEAPSAVKALNSGGMTEVRWKQASQHREIKEYEIHRSSSQTGTFTKVGTVPETYTYLDVPSKITSSQNSITVDSTAEFPAQGVLEIIGLSTERPSELVQYTGKTATSFTGLTRGFGGTQAAEHYNDSFVWLSRTYHGYTESTQANAWYKVRSVEWSGLVSEFSTPVSAVSGGVTFIPQPTITTVPTSGTEGTKLSVNFFLHGIGKGGDNVNSASSGNLNPIRPIRQATIELFNSANQLVATKQGNVNFNNTSGNFLGNIEIGAIASGAYTARVKLPQYLRKTYNGILQIANGQTMQLNPMYFVTGDINNDNALSILDYNMIYDCFSELSQPRNCADANKKLMADITDDGIVNQFDYNLFLRELSVQSGQ